MSLKLKNYATGVQIVDNGDLAKRILHFLLVSLGALALFYILILGSMVFNIVARKSLEAQARTLGDEVGNLELSYLSATNKVDLAFSAMLGFKETKIVFAHKSAGTLGSTKVATNDL